MFLHLSFSFLTQLFHFILLAMHFQLASSLDTHSAHFASHRVIFQTQPRRFSTQLLKFCLRFNDCWSRQNKPLWLWEEATDRPLPLALWHIVLCEKRESVGGILAGIVRHTPGRSGGGVGKGSLASLPERPGKLARRLGC